MAEVTIITRYLADKSDLQAKVDQIIVQQKKLKEGQKEIATDQQKANIALKAAAEQREKLLRQEIQTLKELKTQSKLAFTVPEIKQFNDRIAESKRNISLLKGETQTVNPVIQGLKTQFLQLGAGVAAAFSVKAIFDFLKSSVGAFQEAELNAKKLETAIVNIGNEGEAAFQKLIDQSEQLQAISIFSDDDIQRAQTQLAQFGLLSNEIEAIIPKILDLASATGIDLTQATEIAIQAINGNVRALKQYGLDFENTGNEAQNLAIFTEKLNKFQGQTAAVLETSAGAAKNLGNQFDELKERIGAAIADNTVFKNVLAQLGTQFEFLSFIFSSNEARAAKAAKIALDRAKSDIEAEVAVMVANGKTRLEALSEIRRQLSADAEKSAARLAEIDSKIPTVDEAKEREEILKTNTALLAKIRATTQLLLLQAEQKKTALGDTEEEKTRKETEALQKKQKELEEAEKKRQKLLAEEKKTQEEINKLRVETEPDIQEKIAIQKQIDEALTKVVEEDKRKQDDIVTSLNEKKNKLIVLQNLKAFQEISRVETQRSFEEDERNLTQFVNERTRLLLDSGLKAAELERQLTALTEVELKLRLQNAIDANNATEKDTKESKERIKKAEADLTNFQIDQVKKAGEERLKVQQDIQAELLRQRQLSITPGGTYYNYT